MMLFRTRPRSVVLAGVGATLVCVVLIAVLCLTGAASPQNDGPAEKQPRSSVHALLLIDRSGDNNPLAPPARMNAEEFANYVNVQMALLKSRLVIQQALRAPSVAKLPVVKQQKDPVAWLEKRLDVDNLVATEIVRVAVHGDTPEEQALLVNAVVDAYLQEVIHKDQRVREDRMKRLRQHAAEYEARLRDKRQALRRVQKQLGVEDNVSPNEQFALKQLGAIEKELLETQAQIRKAKIDAALLKAAADEKQLAATQQRIAQLRTAEAMLTGERSIQLAAIRQLKSSEVDLDWLKDEVRVLEGVQRKAVEQIQQIEVELPAPPRVQLLENAVPGGALGQ